MTHRCRFTLAAVVAALAVGSDLRAEYEWERVLFGNEVQDLLFRDGEAVWATTSGLVQMDMSDSSATIFRRDERALKSDSVNVVAVDADGNLWCGTDSEGIAIRTPQNRWEFIRTFDGLPVPRVLSLARGEGRQMIVGTGNGVVTFEDLETRAVTTSCTIIDPCVDVFPSLTVSTILRFFDASRSRHVVWYGTAAGVVEEDLGNPGSVYRTVSDGFSNASVRVLFEFGGDIWAGTDDGAYRYDDAGDTWVMTPAGGFSGFRDFVVFGGELWGASSDRVGRWDGVSWVRMGGNFLGNALPTCLAVDDTGTLWAGTTGGLRRWTGTTWSPPLALDGLVSARPPWSIVAGPGGSAWMGFKASHAGRYDGDTWSFVDATTSGGGFDPSATQGLLLEPGGTIWFGHCCCSGPGCFVNRLTGDPNVPGNWTEFGIRNIRAMVRGPGSHYFFGTGAEDPAVVGEGLYFWTTSMDPASPAIIQAGTTPLASNAVTGLAFDAVGRLWIGHRESGVDIWRYGADPTDGIGDQWLHLREDDMDDPLLSDQVLALVAEGTRVWVGTTAGVALYDGDVLVGEWGAGSLGSSFVTAMSAASDGSVWVGTMSGIVRFVPNAVGTYDLERTRFPDLANERVNGIATRGTDVWVASERGLSIGRPAPETPGGPAGPDRLGHAYPNPFRLGGHDGVRLTDVTTVVSGRILDAAGHVVARFRDVAPGDVVWNGRIGDDQDGNRAAPGLYAVVARSATVSVTARIAVIE